MGKVVAYSITNGKTLKQTLSKKDHCQILLLSNYNFSSNNKRT